MPYNFDLATPLNYGIQKREEEASHDIFHSIARMAGGALVGLISGGPIGMAAGGASALSSEFLGPEAGAVVGAATSKYLHGRQHTEGPAHPNGAQFGVEAPQAQPLSGINAGNYNGSPATMPSVGGYDWRDQWFKNKPALGGRY